MSNSEKTNKHESPQVCKEPPEKALQGTILVIQVGPWKISPLPQDANQNVYPRETRAEEKEVSFCFQENKIFSLSCTEKYIFPGAKDRKGISGKEITKARTRRCANGCPTKCLGNRKGSDVA